MTEEIRRKKPQQHTRQGRCQPRSLDLFRKKRWNWQNSRSVTKTTPCTENLQGCRLRSSVGAALGLTLTAQAVQHWEDWMTWLLRLDGDKYVQMESQKIFYLYFSKQILTNNFFIFKDVDTGEDESSSPSLLGASCCCFWGSLRPPSPAALVTAQLKLVLSSPPLWGPAGPHRSDWKTQQGAHISSSWKFPMDLLPAFCFLASSSCQ